MVIGDWSLGNLGLPKKLSDPWSKIMAQPSLFLGSIALLWQNTKCNVIPGRSYFKQYSLACARLLTNLHLHFAFCQSKATLPKLQNDLRFKRNSFYIILALYSINFERFVLWKCSFVFVSFKALAKVLRTIAIAIVVKKSIEYCNIQLLTP